MGIFKKTIKYSKPSKDLDNKIKNLDEELKQTGVINNQDDSEISCIQESSTEKLPEIYDEIEVEKKEESLYNWREVFIIENDETQNIVEETEYKTVRKVESYISESNKELIEIRDQVFQEISESTLLNLPEIKNKIEKVLEIYDQIQEGLLNEPPETKNQDPLTPLNQNFVTTEELNKHYTLFINRIQEQLATVGGGGETRLKYLDDIVGIATNPGSYNGKFLKYDHSLGKFVFDDPAGGGGGSGNYANVAGIATYAALSGVSTYAVTAGIATFATLSGVSTYASIAGVSTYASTSGIATYATLAGVSTYSSTSGIATYADTADIATSAGTATTSTYLSDAANIITGTINKDRISTTNALTVLGDLYVSNNISFGGTTTQLNTQQLEIVDADIVLGIGTSFSPTDNTANHGGIAIASTEGSPLVSLNIVPGETNPTTYKKIMWFKGDTIGVGLTDAWLFNYAVGIGSTQVPNGVRLAAGAVQFTERDLSVVRSVNASGIVTGSSFRPSSGYIQAADGTNSLYIYSGTGNVAFQGTIGASKINNASGYNAIDFSATTTPNVLVPNDLIVSGVNTSSVTIPTQLRTRSVAERTTLVSGNTVGLAFTTGGGNVAICTNPTGDITLNVTSIPTDSTFDNHSISFSVIVTQTGTARTCTAVNLNGVSRTIHWSGKSLAASLSGVTTTSGYDIFTFTGINTVGSASTTANYVILGSVNGGFAV